MLAALDLLRSATDVFDHRAHNIDRLKRAISLFDRSVVTSRLLLRFQQCMYACFLEVLTWLVHTNVPVNVVRLGLRDPLLLHLSLSRVLCKRNYLRRRGRYLEAILFSCRENKFTYHPEHE